MSTALLQVMDRKESSKKARKNGFVPAVIYGEGFEHGMPVKVEMLKLNKVLRNQGKTPRFLVKVGEEEKEVLVKEIQRHPITDEILHLDMQVLTGNERVRVKVPVIMTGRELLERNNLILEVFNSEVEISGPANALPDSISINVSEMKAGDVITAGDVKLMGEDIHMHTPAGETLAVVSFLKHSNDEEDEDKEE